MSNATITPVYRRAFDLHRTVYAVRCGCGWKTEVATIYLAEAVRQRHECPEEA